MKVNRRALLALCLFCLLRMCNGARAADLYFYDLDSLAYMSSDVIEADIIGPKPNKGFEIAQVRVTDVYKGHFKKD